MATARLEGLTRYGLQVIVGEDAHAGWREALAGTDCAARLKT